MVPILLWMEGWAPALVLVAMKSIAIAGIFWFISKKYMTKSHASAYRFCVCLFVFQIALPWVTLLPVDFGLRIPVGLHEFLDPIDSDSYIGPPKPLVWQDQTLWVQTGTHRMLPFEVKVILSMVWILGLVFMLVLLGKSWIDACVILRRSVKADPLGDLPVRKTKEIPTPAIFGWRKPVLLMPDYPFSPQELEFIKTHESFHIVRRDHWMQGFSWLVLSVFWFNPFLWAMWKRLLFYLESSTDDAVLLSGAQPSKYAELLLRLAKDQKKKILQSLGIGWSARDRIENVLRPSTRVILSPFQWGLPVLLALLLGLYLGVFRPMSHKPEYLFEFGNQRDAFIWGTMFRRSEFELEAKLERLEKQIRGSGKRGQRIQETFLQQENQLEKLWEGIHDDFQALNGHASRSILERLEMRRFAWFQEGLTLIQQTEQELAILKEN